MTSGAYAILIVLVLVIVAVVVYRARQKGGCDPACISPQTCVAGSCVTPCSTNGECIPPQVCQGGLCVTPPGCHPACIPPLVCQGSNCVTPPGCHPACIAPQVCRNGNCVTPAPVLYGASKTGGLLAMFDPAAGGWTPFGPADKMLSIRYNPKDGAIYGLKSADGNLYSLTPGGAAWAPLANPGSVLDIAFDPAGNMYGTAFNLTLATKGANYGGVWANVPGASTCCPVSIDFGRAGVLYGIGWPSKNVYTMASANPASGWIQIPNTTGVNTIAVGRSTGAFYGVGPDGYVYTTPSLGAGWTQVPNSGGVQVVSSAPGG
jgi:hypothetical protein